MRKRDYEEIVQASKGFLWVPVGSEVAERFRFVKGPIPLNWLRQASILPGKCFHVGMALWFMEGITKEHTIKLTRDLCRVFHIGRSSKYRALRFMEEAGLVQVYRQRGSNPLVTILSLKELGE